MDAVLYMASSGCQGCLLSKTFLHPRPCSDGGNTGPKLRGALAKIGDWNLQIVKRSDIAKGFG